MCSSKKHDLLAAPLGKSSSYVEQYDASLLFPIPRQTKRDEIGVPEVLPFSGCDIWNAYEVSWLNKKGKPVVALAEFNIPCTSENIIESKSFKLYLNSLNNSMFDSVDEVKKILMRDLTAAVGTQVEAALHKESDYFGLKIEGFTAQCLDELDIECDTYRVEPSFLKIEADETVEQNFYSSLLKSNCLVTGQPDWGTVFISYKGRTIDPAGLLKYIVSFRNHNEFHEQCVERIFMDIMQRCQPERLTVYARYTRRGGLDINPFRSTESGAVPPNMRLPRQ